MTTIAQAKETTIFYVENENVIESSYYDYLCEYGQGDDTSSIEEEEKTYYIVDSKEFDSETEAEEYCEENDLNIDLIKEIEKTFYTHVVRYHANYGRKVKSRGWESEDLEEVEAEFIQGLEWYVSEKNWDAPEYFSSKEEAEESRIERGAESMGLDKEVFISIERKQKIVNERRAEILSELTAKTRAQEAIVFEKYKNIISKEENESYNQTKDRLAAALPEKINGSVFHKIIKTIRNNG